MDGCVCPQCKGGEGVLEFIKITAQNTHFFCHRCQREIVLDSFSGYLPAKGVLFKETFSQKKILLATLSATLLAILEAKLPIEASLPKSD